MSGKHVRYVSFFAAVMVSVASFFVIKFAVKGSNILEYIITLPQDQKANRVNDSLHCQQLKKLDDRMKNDSAADNKNFDNIDKKLNAIFRNTQTIYNRLDLIPYYVPLEGNESRTR